MGLGSSGAPAPGRAPRAWEASGAVACRERAWIRPYSAFRPAPAPALLDHQSWPEVPSQVPAAGVEPVGQAEGVQDPVDEDETASVGDSRRAVADSQGPRRALRVRSASTIPSDLVQGLPETKP